jgi:DNA-binding beta-propeller fold protein YncE
MHPQAQIAMQMQRQNPIGVAVDGAGSVFVSDYGGNRVVVFSAAGEVVRTIGGPGSGEGQLNQPCGVAVDGDGNWLRT